jgi:hypothetical protein
MNYKSQKTLNTVPSLHYSYLQLLLKWREKEWEVVLGKEIAVKSSVT